MSDLDQLCLQTVDTLAAELLALGPDELLDRPDYGIVNREVGGKEMPVGFWHYTFGDTYHIHFKLSRRWFWFIHTSYVSGIVFGSDSAPRLMTPLEAGEYL